MGGDGTIFFTFFLLVAVYILVFVLFFVDSGSRNIPPTQPSLQDNVKLLHFTLPQRAIVTKIMGKLGVDKTCVNCFANVTPVLLVGSEPIPAFSEDPKEYYLEPYHHMVRFYFLLRLFPYFLENR
jgi:hypothetical protein